MVVIVIVIIIIIIITTRFTSHPSHFNQNDVWTFNRKKSIWQFKYSSLLNFKHTHTHIKSHHRVISPKKNNTPQALGIRFLRAATRTAEVGTETNGVFVGCQKNGCHPHHSSLEVGNFFLKKTGLNIFCRLVNYYDMMPFIQNHA